MAGSGRGQAWAGIPGRRHVRARPKPGPKLVRLWPGSAGLARPILTEDLLDSGHVGEARLPPLKKKRAKMAAACGNVGNRPGEYYMKIMVSN